MLSAVMLQPGILSVEYLAATPLTDVGSASANMLKSNMPCKVALLIFSLEDCMAVLNFAIQKKERCGR
jgi:hypothetical protein